MFIDQENNYHITNEELMQKRSTEKVKIIDVREVFEYKICHIPESTLIPLRTLLHDPNKYFSKEETYYILCHTGQRSYYVTDLLTKKGFKVVNVLGGIADNDKYNVPY